MRLASSVSKDYLCGSSFRIGHFYNYSLISGQVLSSFYDFKFKLLAADSNKAKVELKKLKLMIN